MEVKALSQGTKLQDLTLEQMDAIWNDIKHKD
jgi:hypothetical protein